MKAAFITKTGPPEVIQYGELPSPTLAPTQCLIKVGAVAVNPIDTYIRSGAVRMPLPFPFVIGSDFAGTVEHVGDRVSRFKPGDRVWGSNQGFLNRQGSFAEYITVDECWVYPTPGQISDEEAAAIALVGITAYLGLVREADLKPGEILFVNGGSGGVGSAVVQMAKALGAKVITTAGTSAKLDLCRAMGADHAFSYKSGDFAEEIKKAAPDGVNVWWETVREPDFDRAVGHLAEGGRMVLMAGREARPRFPVGPFYVKGCRLHGFVMYKAKPDEQRAAADRISNWMSQGKLKARIADVMPLSEAATAHKIQEASISGQLDAPAGKLVLKP